MEYLNKVVESLSTVDYKTILAEFFITKTGEEIIDQVKTSFKNSKEALYSNENEYLKTEKEISLDISKNNLINSIIYNIDKSVAWSKDINIKILPESKELKDIFINLDLYVTQLRERMVNSDQIDKISSANLLSRLDKNIILYGSPGAGKTTLMMNTFNNILKLKNVEGMLFCPIVIRFRETIILQNNLNENFGLFDILASVFSISISDLSGIANVKLLEKRKELISKIYSSDKSLAEKKIKEEEGIFEKAKENLFQFRVQIEMILSKFIDDSNMILILEGFDEIPSSIIKRQIEKDLNTLSLSLKKSRFILTTRNGEFNSILNNTRIYEVCPLSLEQIEIFSRQWLKDDNLAFDLLTKIKSSPFFDTAIRPLTLAYLCGIYESRRDIPPKPRYVYDYVLNLLIDTWDRHRQVDRKLSYRDLYVERMKEFLANFAYEITYSLRKTVFNTFNLTTIYKKICNSYGLPKDEAQSVVEEIERHNGLLIKVSFDSYQFAHKSLQEFLTAKHIQALPTFPEKSIFEQLPNEMAIVVSSSSDINGYLGELIKYINSIKLDYWLIFLTRLHIEKPDFNDKEEALVFIFNLYDIARKAIRVNKDIITPKNLLYVIERLLIDTNIVVGLSSFQYFYNTFLSLSDEDLVEFSVINQTNLLHRYSNLSRNIFIDNALYYSFIAKI